MSRWDFKPGKKHHDYPLYRRPAMMRGGFKPFKPPKVLEFKRGGGIWDILGSIAGPVVGAGASMMGLSPGWAGLAAGLTGTLATGDVGRGVASGLAGYGLGQAIDQFAAAGVDPVQAAGQSPIQTKGTGSYTGHPGDLTRDQAAAWDRVSGISAPDPTKLSGGEKWDAFTKGLTWDNAKDVLWNKGMKTSLPLGLGILGSIPQRYERGGGVDILAEKNESHQTGHTPSMHQRKPRYSAFKDQPESPRVMVNPSDLELFLSHPALMPELWAPPNDLSRSIDDYVKRQGYADGGRVMNAPPPVTFRPGVDPEWNWFNRGNINEIAGGMLGNGPGLTSATNTPPSSGPATPIWNNDTGGPNSPTGGISVGPPNAVAQAIATGLSLASPAPAGTIGTIASALGLAGIHGALGNTGLAVANDQSSNNVAQDVGNIAAAIASAQSQAEADALGLTSAPAPDGSGVGAGVGDAAAAGIGVGADAAAGIGGVGDAGNWRHGGLIRPYNSGGLIGPGDGQSDSIPAMIDGQQPAALSTGEYVLDASTVSAIGRGDTNAGIKKLDQMVMDMKRKWAEEISKWKPRS